ncbi:MAG: DEAD/DEAH box helicase [Deltaproteobacteria bacterium]|nr:DEAD/DEAH box helicase [Deltaproteobacteria bacterium]
MKAKVIVNSALHITGAGPDAAQALRDRLTFTNPKWEENERRGFSNWDTPRELCFLEKHGDALILPRGFARQALGILKRLGVPYTLEDRRRTLPPVDFTFRGKLKDFQAEAVRHILKRDFGTLSAPTGSGKTVMALAVIAHRKQPALIIVHTKELLEQWRARIETFLGIPAREVGIIGNGKLKVGERITVALVQTLYKHAPEVAPHIGFLIVDECHRTPARTFTEAVTAFDCKYMLGLSATPWRRDGLSRLIYWHLGDKVHEVDKAALVDAGHILQAEVVWRETGFHPLADPSEEYSAMLSELTRDPARNALIADDIAREAQNDNGIILALSDRKAHCETLVNFLADRGIRAALLTGDLSNGERQSVVAALNAGQVKVLIATGQLIGEGFDCPGLSTLFVTTPLRFSGRVLQYLGRILRPAPGKEKAEVYDYIDPVGVLRAAAKARARVYNAPQTGMKGDSRGF